MGRKIKRTNQALVTAVEANEFYKLVPERLAEEDELEYGWFCCYCFLGLERTLPKLIKQVIIPSEPPGTTYNNAYLTAVKRICGKNRWVDRAKLYDAKRTIQATDSLIYTQQKIDAEWLDKGEQTRKVIQQSIEIALRIQTCSFQVLNALEPKISALNNTLNSPKSSGLIELGRVMNIVTGVATTTKTVQEILRNCWEGKEYTDAIQQLQQDILSIELDSDSSASGTT